MPSAPKIEIQAHAPPPRHTPYKVTFIPALAHAFDGLGGLLSSLTLSVLGGLLARASGIDVTSSAARIPAGAPLLGFRDDGSAHGGLASRNDFAGADNVRCSPDEPPVAAEPRRALVGTYHKRRRRCRSTRAVGFEARGLALQGGTEDCARGSSTTLARGFGSYSDPRFARAGAVFFDSSVTKLFSMPPIKPVYTTPSSASSSYVDLRRARCAGSGALDARSGQSVAAWGSSTGG